MWKWLGRIPALLPGTGIVVDKTFKYTARTSWHVGSSRVRRLRLARQLAARLLTNESWPALRAIVRAAPLAPASAL